MIDELWIRLVIDFDHTNCLDAIKNVVELTDSYFYVKEDWTVIFNPTVTNHMLTAGKDVQSIDIVEDASEIVNKIMVEYDWWTYVATDSTSITDYGLFEKKYSKSDLKDLASATLFGDEELINKAPKQKVTLTLNNRYILESINPWDTIRVRNMDYYIINVQVKNIVYNVDTLIVYLDDFDSIGKVFLELKK